MQTSQQAAKCYADSNGLIIRRTLLWSNVWQRLRRHGLPRGWFRLRTGSASDVHLGSFARKWDSYLGHFHWAISGLSIPCSYA